MRAAEYAAPFRLLKFVCPRRPRFPLGSFHSRQIRGDRKAASPGKNAATRQHRPAITLPLADALLVQQALQLVGASVTLGTQSVSGAPIAQYHRKAQSVPVQDRPISTSFPSLEGQSITLRRNTQPSSVTLTSVSPRAKSILYSYSEGQHENLFFPSCPQREREVHLVLFVLLLPPEETTNCRFARPRKFEHHFNVVSAQLARARFDIRDHVAHHPLATPADEMAIP